jgi:hypothetical protein
MATPKERQDERQRARDAQQARDDAPPQANVGAQQQGDGQPENARELEDPSSGSAQSDDRSE